MCSADNGKKNNDVDLNILLLIAYRLFTSDIETELKVSKPGTDAVNENIVNLPRCPIKGWQRYWDHTHFPLLLKEKDVLKKTKQTIDVRKHSEPVAVIQKAKIIWTFNSALERDISPVTSNYPRDKSPSVDKTVLFRPKIMTTQPVHSTGSIYLCSFLLKWGKLSFVFKIVLGFPLYCYSQIHHRNLSEILPYLYLGFWFFLWVFCPDWL